MGREPSTPAYHAWIERGDGTTRDLLWRAMVWELAAVEAWMSHDEPLMQTCIDRARTYWKPTLRVIP